MTRVPKSIRSTRQILNGPNDILHSLLSQSRDLISVTNILNDFVEQKVEVSSLKNKELLLFANNAAIATKIRYRQRNLISALRKAGLDVNSLKIKVQPVFEPVKLPQVERELSNQNAAHLAEIAQHIEHEPLKKALLKLSRHSKS
jgi:hypothetical protein